MTIKLEKKGKNFLLKNDNEEIIVNLECYVPFGLESYNYSKIINLEFKNKNNEHYNYLNELRLIEEEILDSLPEDFKKNRQYVGIFYKRENSVLMRTYLDKSKHKNKEINIYAKQNNCECEIQFTSLWSSETKYGILINLRKLKLKEN